MEPALVLLTAPAGIAFLVCPGFVINGVDGEHHDFARIDVRTENVVHMEVLKVEETACLAGNKENRLAAMTVNLEFHIAVQIVRVIFEITNFHERYSFGQYKRKCACAASHRVKAFFPFSDGRQNKPISSGSNGKSGNLGFLAGLGAEYQARRPLKSPDTS